MGLKRIFNEWREKADGTLTGPALETDDETINNSITYPDGSTITTSPSSGGSDYQWTKDSGSPGTVSGSSATLQLADTYDSVLLNIRDLTSGNNGSVELRFNGDSGSNYGYVDTNSSSTTGATSLQLTNDMRRANNINVLIDGRFNNTCTATPISGLTAPRTEDGENDNITSPLDSIEVLTSTSFALEIAVYGRDTL